MAAANIHALLTNNSMRIYYVMLKNDIFHNHLTQGIVALYRLGASEERINEFISDSMAQGGGCHRAEEKGYDAASNEVITDEEAAALLGKSESYYKLVHYYDHKLKTKYGESLTEFIKAEMRQMGSGILAEATHGIIEIGHGYSVGQAGMVVEGMAWLHHGFAPPGLPMERLNAPFEPGTTTLKEMLTKLENDSRIKEILLKAYKDDSSGKTGFDRRLAAVWGPESETILNYLNETNLELPSDAKGAGIRLVDIALTVFIASKKRNEFFLLHGVTGAWSVAEILPLLDEETVRLCVRTFLMGILGLYVVQGSPPFDWSYIPSPPADLKIGWPEIVAKAIAYKTSDPHAYKLVQVCHDLAKEASKEKQGFYKSGALVALYYPRRMFDDPV